MLLFALLVTLRGTKSQRGLSPIIAATSGVTICFGGIMRDVLCGRDIAIGGQSYVKTNASKAKKKQRRKQFFALTLLIYISISVMLCKFVLPKKKPLWSLLRSLSNASVPYYLKSATGAGSTVYILLRELRLRGVPVPLIVRIGCGLFATVALRAWEYVRGEPILRSMHYHNEEDSQLVQSLQRHSTPMNLEELVEKLESTNQMN